ncbi:hypothetical protein T01_12430 [Trichinella spiralis]|uniref:Uncharacterized protein n=1 Tax=Trichinella spiralis TaxID=6334 RepID=A0A0V0Z299_TRISP|nr:hypothetical protein T01_9790 [Trichinella spiralis]KRY06103.1 hypothetical protein T01_506 [Trichinella spiralis]KRY06504.1 hypothetical protein T01_12430 [Trichinella spiralis]
MRLCSKSLINVLHRPLSDIFASFVTSDELSNIKALAAAHQTHPSH